MARLIVALVNAYAFASITPARLFKLVVGRTPLALLVAPVAVKKLDDAFRHAHRAGLVHGLALCLDRTKSPNKRSCWRPDKLIARFLFGKGVFFDDLLLKVRQLCSQFGIGQLRVRNA